MSDVVPMGKPYLASDMEYLQLYKIQTWEDGDPTGNDDSEYSEFQKPYAHEDNPEYAWWEWTWPDYDFPDIPPVTWPDPIPNDCNVDEGCSWAGIMGPDEVECDSTTMYSQAHVWIGCGLAPWYAAYGQWFLYSPDPERVYLLFDGPVSATVRVEEDATADYFILYYEAAGGCSASYKVLIEECCDPTHTCDEGITLTGADTVTQGDDWVGTISPACPGAMCEVDGKECESWDCVVNEAGSEVTVSTSGRCGSFTVTVGDDCGTTTSSKNVRISGGSYQQVATCNSGYGWWCSYYQDTCYLENLYYVDNTGMGCKYTGEGSTTSPCSNICGVGWNHCTEGDCVGEDAQPMCTAWDLHLWKCDGEQTC